MVLLLIASLITAGCTTTFTTTTATTTTTTTLTTTTPVGPPENPVEEVNLTVIEIFKSYLEFGHFDRIANFFLSANALELTTEQKEQVMENWINTYGDDYENYAIVNLYYSPPEGKDVSEYLSSQGILLYYECYVTFFQQRGEGEEKVYTPHRENLDLVFKDGRWWLLLLS